MDQLTVACVQQRMYVPVTLDEYRESLRRFLRVAANKHAGLVVFPELGGMMVGMPLLDDFRSNLLKRADLGTRRNAGFWQRIMGSLSGGMASYLRADLRRSAAGILDVSGGQVWDTYVEMFGELAKEYGLTLVAPSAYLPDPLDGVIRNLAVVFGSSGEMLGTQAKVVLHPTDVDMAQPGNTWDVIQTEGGCIGLIIGGDVLYPEVGRLLAYQGADVLVTQAACLDMPMYHKMRSGVLARMQDNQLYAVASFLVGPNVLTRDQDSIYAGKSAIFAPQELTPRSNGVLVEMGGSRSEGIVAAEWDFEDLKQLWESSDTPLRRTLSSAEVGSALGEIYTRLQRLPPVAERPLIAPASGDSPSELQGAPVTLDDLTVLDSHESDWPVGDMTSDSYSYDINGPDDGDRIVPADDGEANADASEDETDEFDSLSTPL